MRSVLPIAATALSALLYSLAFPPLGAKPLAWVCLVPFLLAVRSQRSGGALLLGFLMGEFMGLAMAEALPWGISHYFLQSSLVSWLFALFAYACIGSLYITAFAWTYRALAARYVRALPLLTAAAWAAMELGRGRLLSGSTFGVASPWALLGYTQVGFAPLVQVASLAGVYGISFVLAAGNASVAELLHSLRAGGPWGAAFTNLGIAALLTGVALAHGQLELRAAPRIGVERASVPVAIVQANLDLGARWRTESFGRNLDEHLALTLRAIATGSPKIVFWPENVFTFHIEEEPLFRGAIARVLAVGDVELVAGGPSATDSTPPRYHSSVFLMDPTGRVLGRYDKRILVPFAEYEPLPGLDLARRSFQISSFSPGTSTPPLETRAGPAGILICNEAMLPEAAAERVRNGAAYLVNPSNDTWIAKPRWAKMMLDLVSLRAVEQRRYLVRASTSGPSAIVDPWGRVVVRSELSQPEVLLGAIEPMTDLTPYARLGDAFAFACAASVAAALTIRWRRRAALA